MQARMKNPAISTPGAMQALLALDKSTAERQPALCHAQARPPARQPDQRLQRLRRHARARAQEGRRDRRADLRRGRLARTPYFTDAERAALALTEAVTRLSDRADPVPDESGNEAARHYDEPALAALVMQIASSTSGTASTPPPGRWRARPGTEADERAKGTKTSWRPTFSRTHASNWDLQPSRCSSVSTSPSAGGRSTRARSLPTAAGPAAPGIGTVGARRQAAAKPPTALPAGHCVSPRSAMAVSTTVMRSAAPRAAHQLQLGALLDTDRCRSASQKSRTTRRPWALSTFAANAARRSRRRLGRAAGLKHRPRPGQRRLIAEPALARSANGAAVGALDGLRLAGRQHRADIGAPAGIEILSASDRRLPDLDAGRGRSMT